jgi:hypothetical protein
MTTLQIILVFTLTCTTLVVTLMPFLELLKKFMFYF